MRLSDFASSKPFKMSARPIFESMLMEDLSSLLEVRSAICPLSFNRRTVRSFETSSGDKEEKTASQKIHPITESRIPERREAQKMRQKDTLTVVVIKRTKLSELTNIANRLNLLLKSDFVHINCESYFSIFEPWSVFIWGLVQIWEIGWRIWLLLFVCWRRTV